MSPKLVDEEINVTVAVMRSELDNHLVECTAANDRVDKRLVRIEMAIVAALVMLVGVLWQNYSSTHPAIQPQQTTTQSYTTSVTTPALPKR